MKLTRIETPPLADCADALAIFNRRLALAAVAAQKQA